MIPCNQLSPSSLFSLFQNKVHFHFQFVSNFPFSFSLFFPSCLRQTTTHLTIARKDWSSLYWNWLTFIFGVKQLCQQQNSSFRGKKQQGIIGSFSNTIWRIFCVKGGRGGLTAQILQKYSVKNIFPEERKEGPPNFAKKENHFWSKNTFFSPFKST